jgi:hypothetical protein
VALGESALRVHLSLPDVADDDLIR